MPYLLFHISGHVFVFVFGCLQVPQTCGVIFGKFVSPGSIFISCLKRPCPKGVLVKFRRLVLSVCARCVLVTWGRRSDQRQRNCADQQLRPRASRVSTLCLLASLARVGMKDQTNSSPVGKHSLLCFLKIGVGKHLKQLAKIMWNKLRHTRTKQMNFIIVFC